MLCCLCWHAVCGVRARGCGKEDTNGVRAYVWLCLRSAKALLVPLPSESLAAEEHFRFRNIVAPVTPLAPLDKYDTMLSMLT